MGTDHFTRCLPARNGGSNPGSRKARVVVDRARGPANAAAVRLPDTMPLQLQVFIVGVVAIQWLRAQSASVFTIT